MNEPHVTQSMLLNMSQAALNTALEELKRAKMSLEWAKDKLIDAQDENRKLRNTLVSVVEAPTRGDLDALLRELDKPCGFIPCELTKSAAKTIRQLYASNAYLRDENRRLKGGSDT